MSEQHTAGRVFLTDTGRIGAGDPQRHDRLKIHSPWIEDAWDGDAEADANMRRLAACWNACEGISTDTLERGPDSVFIYAGDLTKQRDELLQALQFAIRFHDQLTPSDVERMRKIVAKATGSAT